MKRIALLEMIYLNTKAIISTVKLFNYYETMVMFEDGDEIESFKTFTEADAKKLHNEVVNKWNDKLYEGSTAKLLGAENLGQFVKTIKSC